MNNLIYIIKQEGLYQNKVTLSLVSIHNCKMTYWIRSMKFETVRIHFLSDVLICCHPEILLPWQRDVTTSPLYWVTCISSFIENTAYPVPWPKFNVSEFHLHSVSPSLLHRGWVERQIEHRRSCLIFSARFPAVNWRSGPHPVAKSLWSGAAPALIDRWIICK